MARNQKQYYIFLKNRVSRAGVAGKDQWMKKLTWKNLNQVNLTLALTSTFITAAISTSTLIELTEAPFPDSIAEVIWWTGTEGKGEKWNKLLQHQLISKCGRSYHLQRCDYCLRAVHKWRKSLEREGGWGLVKRWDLKGLIELKHRHIERVSQLTKSHQHTLFCRKTSVHTKGGGG